MKLIFVRVTAMMKTHLLTQ